MARLPDEPWRPLITVRDTASILIVILEHSSNFFPENALTVVFATSSAEGLVHLAADASSVAGRAERKPDRNILFALCLGKITIFDAHTQQCLIDIGSAHLGGWHCNRPRDLRLADRINGVAFPRTESARVSIIIIITC